jgi:raffinose/stachyose/melibiose transport system substrate-binding protein
MRRLATTAVAALVLTAFGGVALAQTTITIESWRTDDSDIWNNQIIPAFEAAHPDIKVVYNPTAPTEYNAALNSRLEGGTAGDIIVCRPFDASLDIYNKGHLTSLNDLPGMSGFSDVAKSAWTTDDGSATFCVPMASVIHGFFYNKDIFAELGLEPPATVDEFHAVLDAIKADGQYVPLVLGTADQWEAATMGFQNIGPNYWKGEEGRLALIDGTGKLTDQSYVDTFAEMAKWGPYMGDGYQAQRYSDSQTLFQIGQGAIYAAGSWDISLANGADFEFGTFPPPVPNAGDTCYISDHTDIGIGLNAASPNKEAGETFLAWVASPEFATIFANALPGFYPLSDTPVAIDNAVAQEMVSWRETCEETIRNSYQILSRGTPNLENELWNVSVGVLNGTMTPEAAAAQVQTGLDAWYKPMAQ